MSSTDETYNGWPNRETWAFNLHWQNDQGFYLWVLEAAGQYLTDTYGSDWTDMPADEMRAAEYGVGEYVVHMITEELAEMSPELWEMMREDVGSFWRVSVADVGRTVVESLGNES